MEKNKVQITLGTFYKFKLVKDELLCDFMSCGEIAPLHCYGAAHPQ